MYKTFIDLRRFLVWLGETNRPAEPLPSLLDWADLPTYHPCRDRVFSGGSSAPRDEHARYRSQ